MSALTVRRAAPAELPGLAAGIRSVYAAAFGRPPWHEPAHKADDYLDRLAADADRPGFGAAVAVTEQGEPVGFATAWTTPDPFPTDRCYPLASSGLGDRRTRELLCGAREVNELAVHPEQAGRGIGLALLHQVTTRHDGTGDGRSWLLTSAAPGGPLDFYRHLGWHPVTRPAPGPDGLVVLLHPHHPGAGAVTDATPPPGAAP
ncbi:GNAT family N-acetyltransferase [Kitasatospora sp. NPDC004289]